MHAFFTKDLQLQYIFFLYFSPVKNLVFLSKSQFRNNISNENWAEYFLYFVPECAHSIYCYCILLQRALMNGWALGDPFLLDWFFLGLLLIKSRFPSLSFLDLDKGVVQKWRHPLRGKGRSAKRWCYSISLFSKMGDKGEGGVKSLKKWVTSFMDSPTILCIVKTFKPINNCHIIF